MSNPNPQPAPPLDLAQFDGHTPGPWVASFDDDFVVSDEGAICEIMPQDMADDDGEVSEDESRAREANNLELIAAAPSLLAECQRQRAEIARLREALQDLVTADDCQEHENLDSLYEAARAALQSDAPGVGA